MASALPHASLPATSAAPQFLSLTLGEGLFALPIGHIREIIEFGGLTELPLMPDFLRGVINLRGAVVPVIDLSVRFGRGRIDAGRRTCVVIVEAGAQLLGILVDGVNEVFDADASQQVARPSLAGVPANFIAAMLRRNERFVIVLDILQMLSDNELAQLADVSEGVEV